MSLENLNDRLTAAIAEASQTGVAKWRETLGDFVEPKDVITTVRKAQCLSQAQLAKAAHTSQSMISFIENGLRPSQQLQKAIATALGVPQEVLWPDLDTLVKARDWLHTPPHLR